MIFTGSKELLEVSPSDFSFSHCSRANKKGGGVEAIFLISCMNVSIGTYSTFEYLALEIRSSNVCLVVHVYHHSLKQMSVFV